MHCKTLEPVPSALIVWILEGLSFLIMEEFGHQIFEVPDVDEDFRSCCEEDEHWLDTKEYLAEGHGGEGDEEHTEDFCECLIRRSEVLDYVDKSLLRNSDDGEQDVEESSLTFCEGHDEDASEGSQRSFEGHGEVFDEFSVRIFFKGVSVYEADVLGSRVSGIGVVMEKSHGDAILQVQKKLEFFVEEVVAEHLALMDGLLEAMRNGFRNVFAFTDSDNVYRQIAKSKEVDDQLLAALGERIHELADTFELFVLRLAPCFELERSLQLAKEATGILGCFIEKCPICGEEKYHSKMIVLDCSHNFCADCIFRYVESKLRISQVPVKCPQLRCKHYISHNECTALFPSISNVSLKRESTEIEMRNLCRFYCPYSDCSVLFSPPRWSTSRASSSVRSDNSCIECPACGRFVCASCWVPWHSSMRCEEYQNLPAEERSIEDITLFQLAESSKWRSCQQCRQMIELADGCYHITCRCGHKFCFSCGAEFRNGAQICQCEMWDESSKSSPASSEHEMEPFNILPAPIDGYSQEKPQLGLIQRFIAGDISLDNHDHCHSPSYSSDSYHDTIKDLNQLPWLERFVWVISDSYHEDYIF